MLHSVSVLLECQAAGRSQANPILKAYWLAGRIGDLHFSPREKKSSWLFADFRKHSNLNRQTTEQYAWTHRLPARYRSFK
jgi:hypothetical protein